MNWEIRYRSSVERDAARLPDHIRTQILDRLSSLEQGPFPTDCRKLKGQKNRYRLKVARDYRVVYTVLQEHHVIIIEFVGHRKDAYRWF